MKNVPKSLVPLALILLSLSTVPDVRADVGRTKLRNPDRGAVRSPAQRDVTIYLTTLGDPTHAGSMIHALVRIAHADDVTDAPFSLTYEPTVLEFVSAEQGEFMDRSYGNAVFMQKADSEHGVVRFGLSRHPGSGGVDGFGILARIVFRVKSPGAPDLELIRPSIRRADGAFVPVSVRQRRTGNR